MTLVFSRQILEKNSNIKFHESQFSGNRVVPCERRDRRADMTKLIVFFLNFGIAPPPQRSTYVSQPTSRVLVWMKLLVINESCGVSSLRFSFIQVSQEECAKIRESVPCVKVYRYNPKHLCPNLNGYGDNGQRKVWSSGRSTHCTCQLTTLSMPVLECGFLLRQFSSCSQ